ncbi:hypothetical protein [Chamaesiphon sp. VAR_48_metabat_403]|uniref:hypothetical protein n=1 Tax=Chamaesiphon sp. VAR_48_metabat_403 TaxID=2964700 RepID=UPI00286D965F|nr:hypothetical protein [Chamaesiphon sp. VAR_48_metabat_403]
MGRYFVRVRVGDSLPLGTASACAEAWAFPNRSIFTAGDNFSRSDCRKIRCSIGLLIKFYERHTIEKPIELEYIDAKGKPKKGIFIIYQAEQEEFNHSLEFKSNLDLSL